MGVQMQIAGALIGLAASQKAAAAQDMQAQAAREQAEATKITTLQQENQRRDQLRRQLASLTSSMSAQGVALGTSPSILALEEDEKRLAAKDITSIKLMGATNRRKYQIASAGYKAGAKATRLGGFAKAAYQAGDIMNPNVGTG